MLLSGFLVERKLETFSFSQVYYWYDSEEEAISLKLSNCTADPCTLEELVELGKNNPREGWDAECRGSHTPLYNEPDIIDMNKARVVELNSNGKLF